MRKRAIIEAMANQQIINDWLNCGINSEQDLEWMENTSLFDTIFTYFEHLKTERQVFNRYYFESNTGSVYLTAIGTDL